MHMRTTLNLDESLLEEARRITGIQEKTALLHRGLEELIARESARALAALGGTAPKLRPIARRNGQRPNARRLVCQRARLPLHDVLEALLCGDQSGRRDDGETGQGV